MSTGENTEQIECHTDRVTLTPAEFAAKFGRNVVWAYRQIYAGKIKVLEDFRPMLIPLAEVDRFLGRAKTFTGKRSRIRRSHRAVSGGESRTAK
jgi:hypothetical protein